MVTDILNDLKEGSEEGEECQGRQLGGPSSLEVAVSWALERGPLALVALIYVHKACRPLFPSPDPLVSLKVQLIYEASLCAGFLAPCRRNPAPTQWVRQSAQ